MLQPNRLITRIILPFSVAAAILLVFILIITRQILPLFVDPAVGEQIFASLQWLLIGQSVLMIILLSTWLLLLVHLNLLRPFSQLLKYISKNAKENLGLRIPFDSRDVLGDFVKIFESIVQDLQDSELRFKIVTSSAQDAIVIVDNDGRITYWNEAAEKIFGFNADEIMHKEIHRFLIPERFHEKYQAQFPDLKYSSEVGIFRRQLEMTALKKDGTEIPIEVLFSTVLLRGKLSIAGILRDNSKKKQDEIELLKYREHLEEMVLERTRELKEAQDELVNKAIESGRAQLSAMILHNIGNAMTPVNVQVEELMKDDHQRLVGYIEKCYQDLKNNQVGLTAYVNETPRGQEVFAFMGTLIQSIQEQVKDNKKAIRKIFSAVSYMSEIISLQQSYAVAGSETRQLVDLNLLLEDSIRMQQSSLEKRRITLAKDLSKNLPLLKIDKNKLMQVMVNLIKNSYEAIDEMNDPACEKRITFRTFREKEQVVFEIMDTGVGIEPEKISS
ncbi:MAG: PAS domain S-box protein, partial [SAR324 cluster bacterium]|nr:PAS domain S-box protein [SAR324 cluster bacterium]